MHDAPWLCCGMGVGSKTRKGVAPCRAESAFEKCRSATFAFGAVTAWGGSGYKKMSHQNQAEIRESETKRDKVRHGRRGSTQHVSRLNGSCLATIAYDRIPACPPFTFHVSRFTFHSHDLLRH